jgi:hypothetical protein
MAISTLTPTKTRTSSFLYILMAVGLAAGIFFAFRFLQNADSFKKKSGLTADVYNGTAEVFINNQSVGKTPFTSESITPGENNVKIKSSNREYNSQINFIPNDNKYIHNVGIFADLGTSDVFSSVQEFWFERSRSGETLKVISDPANASVFIDNAEVGKTPYSSEKLSEGEYDLRIDFPGHETQTARINIKKGYTLNIRVKLFPIPAPTTINLLEGATDFYNLAMDNQVVLADTQNWVNAVIYWNKTRGLNISGTGLNKELVFDYFVDYKGNIFTGTGVLAKDAKTLESLKGAKKAGYLGRIADGPGITQEAKTAVLNMASTTTTPNTTTGGTTTTTTVTGKKATVLQTGTGWLRVRSSPGLNGAEVTKVNVGQTFDILEQSSGWVKIKVSDTVQGWISAEFVSIK